MAMLRQTLCNAAYGLAPRLSWMGSLARRACFAAVREANREFLFLLEKRAA